MNWQRRITAVTGSEVISSRAMAGGDLGGATYLKLADGRELVAKDGLLVKREGVMLQAIASTGAPAPQVRHCSDGLLLMDYVEADGVKGWTGLSDALADLHSPRDETYGWEEDYAFGAVAIPNTRNDDWPQFWAANRLTCHASHIDSSIARRLEALAARLPDFLPKYPTPSLLHGDLWGGNILFHRGGLAALIDPASYIGHREVDVAMLTLFDHPPSAFFETLQLEDGWRERLSIYRLWPLLVHLRLFGNSYRKSVENALHTLGV